MTVCMARSPKRTIAPAPVSATPSPAPVAEVTQEDPNNKAAKANQLSIGNNNLVVARDRALTSAADGSGLGVNV